MEHPKNICGVAKFFKQKSAVARLRVQQKKVESQQRRLQEEEEILRQRRQQEEKVLQETTSYWRKISLPAKLETVINYVNPAAVTSSTCVPRARRPD